MRQQCQDLLAARRYDELQVLLSAERKKLTIEMNQVLPYVPRYLPRFLVAIYSRLLRACLIALAKNRPPLLQEEAWLDNQTRCLEAILEVERQLLAALNQEATALLEAKLDSYEPTPVFQTVPSWAGLG